MSEKFLKFLPGDVLKKREDYLSNLKDIVRSSVENGEEDIVAQRDNVFFCIKCPEKSVVIPAKFMNSPEFKDLENGALQMGEGDNVIPLHNGQYHDMKGRVKITFNVGNNEKIEMILSSEKAESFGKIMVHMDDKNCEIFSKYCKELEKGPRISKVVEAAQSFVQNKPTLSSVDNTNIQQLQGNARSLGGQN